MKKINIFVAGAKSLKSERSALKALTNDLNVKFNEKNISINMTSYENLGDQQDEYNEFIRSQADVIIIVIDRHIGQKTEDELRIAVETKKEKNRPEVFIFLHALAESSLEIKQTISTINEILPDGHYYSEYHSIEDLETKAKERIEKYIFTNANNGHVFTTKKLKKILFGLVLLTLIVWGAFLYNSENYLSVKVHNLTKENITEKGVVENLNYLLPQIQKDANNKINDIIKVVTAGYGLDSTSKSMNKEKLSETSLEHIKVTPSDEWINNVISKIFRKQYTTAEIAFFDADTCYNINIIIKDRDGNISNKWFCLNKQSYKNLQECTKAIADYISVIYSPIASCLADYKKNEGINEYILTNWEEFIHKNSEREKILRDYKETGGADTTYCNLILAHLYEYKSYKSNNPDYSDACKYYRLFMNDRPQYSKGVNEKIKILDEINPLPIHTSLPEQLIKQGQIPKNTNSEQLILVLNQKEIDVEGKTYYKATLHSFEKINGGWKEVRKPNTVNLGVNGIASPNKKVEGDNKTPSGFYPISFVFGYKKDINTKMDFLVVNRYHIWVCDPQDKRYNKLFEDINGEYNHCRNIERLKRNDHLNKYAIVIDYNKLATPGKGSAIFIHVERYKNHGTAGCISMSEGDIIDIIKWLDPQKHPHICISK